jgi:hypothetical protein
MMIYQPELSASKDVVHGIEAGYGREYPWVWHARHPSHGSRPLDFPRDSLQGINRDSEIPKANAADTRAQAAELKSKKKKKKPAGDDQNARANEQNMEISTP